MEPGELISDKRNSITADTLGADAKRAYRQYLRAVIPFRFWAPGANGLWEHQRAATSLCMAYLSAVPILPDGQLEAALVKLPPGAGKTGVLSVLSRCLRNIKHVLIITPRDALVDQMISDIDERFWDRLGYSKDTTQRGSGLVYPNDTQQIEPATIIRLLETSVAASLQSLVDDDRTILVGTFTSLNDILKLSQTLEAPNRVRAAELINILKERIDLIIVDEGHYEPAHNWGGAIRGLSRPTILFSATPYRNDYKSFLVRGTFVFNFSIQDAIQRNIVRSVTFDTPPPTNETSNIRRFADGLSHFFRTRLNQGAVGIRAPKLLVRADNLEDLETLQREIQNRINILPVLVHHRATPEPASNRFNSVARARRNQHALATRIWLHDTKLLEGFDDSSFAGLAIYQPFGNARQLIQQIGRIMRSSDQQRQSTQHAFVTAPSDSIEELRNGWMRYLQFEEYFQTDAAKIVSSETSLPNDLLKFFPLAQYVEGNFRTRFPTDQPPTAGDFLVKKTAAVFKNGEHAADLDGLARQIKSILEEGDRFDIRRVADVPEDVIAFSYYAWRNSPILNTRFFPEWTLGLFLLVRTGSYLFINDTGGLALDFERLPLIRVGMDKLRRTFPRNESVRVTQMSFVGLDISERAIRSQTTRTRSFEDTFTDLLDATFAPTSITGFVSGRPRYVGLTRARISDATRIPVSLKEYSDWVHAVGRLLDADHDRGSRVLDRYAQVEPKPDAAGGRPLSVLLDVSDSVESLLDPDGAAGAAPFEEYDDLCSDLNHGEGRVRISGREYSLTVEYRPKNGRYRISSEALNNVYQARNPGDKSLTEQLNAEQSFRIIAANGSVYSHKYFYRPSLRFEGNDGDSPILSNVAGVSALVGATSEKGEQIFRNTPEWRTKSVFGLIAARVSNTQLNAALNPLGDALDQFDIVVCDDGSTEIADFVMLDQGNKKLALVHAKASRNRSLMGLEALQEVGRQVVASLAFASAAAVSPDDRVALWSTNLEIAELNMQRILKRPKHMRVGRLVEITTAAMEDRSWAREIWIVLGNIMDRKYVNAQLNRADPSQRARQFGFYLEGLRTACARGNAQLKIYCPDDLRQRPNA